MNKSYSLFFVFLFLLTFVSCSEEFSIMIKPNGNMLRTLSFQRNPTDYEIINVTEEEYNELMESNRWKIERIYKIKPLMTESVGITNANSSWNLQVDGLNITGENQTICIIDNGVDYRHQDLGNCTNETFLAGNCSKVIGGYDFGNNDEDPIPPLVKNNSVHNIDHGTHVAGIISGNGSIVGIAPNSQIVALKVFDDNGNGNSDSISDAIDWCVNHSLEYHITVISISLGLINESGYVMYETNCSRYFPKMDEAVQNATENNISVVVATGNEYNTSRIGVPACLPNVIPVGATYIDTKKIDKIAYFTNRNNLLKILAPGVFINSTITNYRYDNMTGTSMATPMVAGAIALINQYLNMSNQTKSPSEIQDLLYDTGKKINDFEYTNINYSRIDIYSALLEIDNTSAQITNSFPKNNTKTTNNSFIFKVNVSDWQLKNITINLYNSTELLYTNTTNITGKQNYSEFNYTIENEGLYYWNYEVFDVKNNIPTTTNNSITLIPVFSELVTPTNLTYTNKNETNFTCNSSSYSINLSNVTFTLYNSTGLLYTNTTNITGTENSTTFNYTLKDYTLKNESEYYWNCFVTNNNSVNYTTDNYTLIYDITIPQIINLSNYTTDQNVTIYWDISEDANVSINIFNLTNSITKSTSEYNKTGALTINGLQNNTEYNFTINFCDKAQNCNLSLDNFTIKTLQTLFCGDGMCNNAETCSSCSSDCGTCPRKSSSGGGSTEPIIGTTTNPVLLTKVSEYSKNLGLNTKVYFQNLKMEKHSIQINKIQNKTVEIELNSEPIIFNLSQNESKKINLSNDEFYDLYVKVNSVLSNKANITIKSINETIINFEKINETNNLTTDNKTSEEKNYSIIKYEKFPLDKILNKTTVNYLLLIIGTIIVLMILIKIIKNGKQKSKATKVKAISKGQ